MTSSMVTNVSAVKNGTYTAKTGAAGDYAGTGFHRILNTQTDKTSGNDAKIHTRTDQSSDQGKDDTEKIRKDNTSAKTDENGKMKSTDKTADETKQTDQTRADETQQTDQTQNTDKTQDTDKTDPETLATLQTAMLQAANQMIDAIAQALGISTDDVKSMMQQMNLSEVSVLQPDQLKNLVLSLTGNTDESSVLTDENLYGTMKNLYAMLQEVSTQVQNDTGISQEDLQNLLIQMQQKNMTGNAETVEGQKVQTDHLPVEDAKFLTNSEIAGQTVQGRETLSTGTQKEDSSKMAAEDELQKAQLQEEQIPGAQTASASQSETGNTNQFLQNFLQNTNQIADAQSTVAEAAKTAFSMADTQHIVDQIVDYMKVQVKEDTSQLEMQLHPESLGTLNIHLSSKEGVMTAQFTTQSEDVRAVIQSQILELRQNLEAQGVKVEAVEVTVANYSQDNTQMQNGQEESNFSGKKKSTRKINLNLDALTLDDTLQSSEDQLTAQIMKANGNTVDYTV